MFEDILKKKNKDKWPCYAVFNSDKIIVFNRFMIPSQTFSIDRKDLTDIGRIDVGKWVCVNKQGVSVESTELLRKLLSV